MNALHRWLHWVATGEPECSLELLEHTSRDDIAELKARMAVAEEALRARGWGYARAGPRRGNPYMTFSGELAVLLVFCLIGLVTAALSLRYAVLNYRAVVAVGGSEELRDGTGHIRSQQIALLLFWLGWTVVGIVATIPAPPAAPVGSTPVGLVIRYLLLGSLGIAAWMTATNFIYGWRQWRKHKPKED